MPVKRLVYPYKKENTGDDVINYKKKTLSVGFNGHLINALKYTANQYIVPLVM